MFYFKFQTFKKSFEHSLVLVNRILIISNNKNTIFRYLGVNNPILEFYVLE